MHFLLCLVAGYVGNETRKLGCLGFLVRLYWVLISCLEIVECRVLPRELLSVLLGWLRQLGLEIYYKSSIFIFVIYFSLLGFYSNSYLYFSIFYRILILLMFRSQIQDLLFCRFFKKFNLIFLFKQFLKIKYHVKKTYILISEDPLNGET